MKKLKDNTIYSKSYWYTKGDWNFSKGDYLMARGVIENYEANLEEIEKIENLSYPNEDDILRFNGLKCQVRAFDDALQWVPSDLRAMCQKKALKGVSWVKLEADYAAKGYPVGVLHSTYQKFIYAIIQEYGLDFYARRDRLGRKL